MFRALCKFLIAAHNLKLIAWTRVPLKLEIDHLDHRFVVTLDDRASDNLHG